MIHFPEDIKIYISLEAIDMRRAIDGLCVAVLEFLESKSQSGDVFLFRNRQGNKVKALVWDKNGFIMIYKRLEKGRFKFPKTTNGNAIEIEHQQLKWLLAGFDFMALKQRPDLYFTDYF